VAFCGGLCVAINVPKIVIAMKLLSYLVWKPSPVDDHMSLIVIFGKFIVVLHRNLMVHIK